MCQTAIRIECWSATRAFFEPPPSCRVADHVSRLITWKGATIMAGTTKYPPELRERAVRMYRQAEPKPVIRQMARQLGVHHEALRNWIRQDEADHGERDDRLCTLEREELVALRAENRELRRANEILKAASAYFAVQLDQTGRRS